MIYSPEDVKRMLAEFKKLARYRTDSWGGVYDTSKVNGCKNDGYLFLVADVERIIKKIEKEL